MFHYNTLICLYWAWLDSLHGHYNINNSYRITGETPNGRLKSLREYWTYKQFKTTETCSNSILPCFVFLPYKIQKCVTHSLLGFTFRHSLSVLILKQFTHWKCLEVIDSPTFSIKDNAVNKTEELLALDYINKDWGDTLKYEEKTNKLNLIILIYLFC